SRSRGALAALAAKQPVPVNVALKDSKDFRLIGTPAKRIDTPAKLDGSAVFGIDVRLPGMKVATVTACPLIGGRVADVDDTGAWRFVLERAAPRTHEGGGDAPRRDRQKGRRRRERDRQRDEAAGSGLPN